MLSLACRFSSQQQESLPWVGGKSPTSAGAEGIAARSLDAENTSCVQCGHREQGLDNQPALGVHCLHCLALCTRKGEGDPERGVLSSLGWGGGASRENHVTRQKLTHVLSKG